MILSEDDSEETITKALQWADDYLFKPFTWSLLWARLQAKFRNQDVKNALVHKVAQLREISEKDYLTELYNMRSMYSKIEFELKRASRYKRQLSCVMMDLDNFKNVNDAHDHLFGSYVLQEIGKLIKGNIRDIDLPARFGGDEFLVVLLDTSRKGTVKFTQRLRKVIEKHLFVQGRDSIKLTISIGFVLSHPGITMKPQDLVKLADLALYKAKKAGRNRVVEQKLVRDPVDLPPECKKVVEIADRKREL